MENLKNSPAMNANSLLRSLLQMFQLGLLSVLLAGPIASCVTALGSAAWWAIALAPVAVLLLVLGARQTSRVPVRIGAARRRRPATGPIGRPLSPIA